MHLHLQRACKAGAARSERAWRGREGAGRRAAALHVTDGILAVPPVLVSDRVQKANEPLHSRARADNESENTPGLGQTPSLACVFLGKLEAASVFVHILSDKSSVKGSPFYWSQWYIFHFLGKVFIHSVIQQNVLGTCSMLDVFPDPGDKSVDDRHGVSSWNMKSDGRKTSTRWWTIGRSTGWEHNAEQVRWRRGGVQIREWRWPLRKGPGTQACRAGEG